VTNGQTDKQDSHCGLLGRRYNSVHDSWSCWSQSEATFVCSFT